MKNTVPALPVLVAPTTGLSHELRKVNDFQTFEIPAFTCASETCCDSSLISYETFILVDGEPVIIYDFGSALSIVNYKVQLTFDDS